MIRLHTYVHDLPLTSGAVFLQRSLPQTLTKLYLAAWRTKSDKLLARMTLCRGAIIVLVGFLLSGCAGTTLEVARANFHSGMLTEAAQNLADFPPNDKDAVLYLMERGSIKQGLGDYDSSTRDWLAAVGKQEELETRSVTKHSASFVVNDRTIPYRGPPFERTLLRTMLAVNFLSKAMWQDAGVEARNIINHLQDLNEYPDDAFSRYVAGLCLELMDDPSNAALQYRNAAGLLKEVRIDDKTGAIITTDGQAQTRNRKQQAELVCLVMLARSPTGSQMVCGSSAFPCTTYAELFINGDYAGRSYTFTDTWQLLRATQDRTAALQITKTAVRLGVKATLAYQIKRQNETLGELAELMLLAFERPDDRRWETLPRLLQVARVPCPRDLSEYEVVFKNSSGRVLKKLRITSPIVRKDNTLFSFCRDIPSYYGTRTVQPD